MLADLPAEPETLRDLMRQPGLWLGLGLVALGCAGLVFAVACLWMMPRAPFEARLAAADAARAPKPALVGQRSPDPASAMPNLASIARPAAEPVAERSASPPETPPARSDAAAAEAAVIAEAEPTSVPPAAAAPVAPELVAAAPAPTEPVASAPVVALAPAAQAMTSPAPEQAPPTAKFYRLQLGAMRTAEGAQQEWERLKHQHGDVLGKLAYAAPRVDLGKRGVFYRIQAGPIAAAGDANRACDALKQRGVSCILVKP